MNDCGLVPKNEEYTTCRVDQWPFSPAMLVLQRIETPMVSRAKCIFGPTFRWSPFFVKVLGLFGA